MAKEKKALGTGLSALFGEDLEESSDNITSLPISKIEPRLQQPRYNFDEEALSSLAESISQYGMIQPITVRLLDSGYYQIIAGERRWRAARLAGLVDVPVKIIEADDKTTAELALVENLQREDLNPIEEAKGYKMLIDEFGLTQDEASKSVGKSRSAIANSIRLLNLSEEVIRLVEKNEISAGHARALIPITNESEQLKAANEITAKMLSVRQTEKLVSQIIKFHNKDSELKDTKDDAIDYLKIVSEEISKKLGRKVRICDGKKTGKIEIEYCGDEDREKLIEEIKKLK
ncbi:MAG: ParB/RepB/Spo0J family partition protein [Eubacteriales bacterium]|nr:ParB/RepB/Spo0J family partition protein [Eubacteriales bacterium]